MEDNNAITEQPNVVNYEEEYNKLANAYTELEKTAKQLYSRVKQLENTWMLTRAEFMFRIVDNNKFDVDTRQKAQKELEEFLFPQKEEQINDKEN
jgi:hypothetical protein